MKFPNKEFSDLTQNCSNRKVKWLENVQMCVLLASLKQTMNFLDKGTGNPKVCYNSDFGTIHFASTNLIINVCR